jgi:hypothetical protein
VNTPQESEKFLGAVARADLNLAVGVASAVARPQRQG